MTTSDPVRRWSFGPLARLHERAVRGPRTIRLAEALADVAGGAAGSLLDVGSGDGLLGAAVAERLGATSLQGVDLAPRMHGGAVVGDGARLPFADASFDVVLLADVLHHARDAAGVLRESLRCARRALIVKDHLARGPWDRALLYAMDVIGNPSREVEIPGGYFSAGSFASLVRSAGARIERVAWPLDVHAPVFRHAFPSELHFAAVLTRVGLAGAAPP